MDHELRDRHRGYHNERRTMSDDPCGPGDAQDVPGFDRATGIDDLVPDAEYGDYQAERLRGRPEHTGEERIELPIPDGAEYDIEDFGEVTIAVQWWHDDDTEEEQ